MNTHANYRGPRPVPRTAAVEEVGRHLAAPGPRDRRPRILVIHGPEGIGKSTLLDQLNQRLNQRTPRALVDCSRYSPDELPDLLTEIKFKLGRRCRAIGRVKFRRFEIGMATTKEELDFSSAPARSLRRLAVLTRRERFPSPMDVKNVVSAGAEKLEVVAPWLSALIGEAAAAATARALAVPLIRDRYQKWHGHRDRGRQDRDDALDELQELNRLAQAAAQADSQRNKRDERLVEALLADVRGAFRHGPLTGSGWHNLVLLLDEADSEAGRALLQRLEDLRSDPEVRRAAVEPLLVVAASRRKLNVADSKGYRLPDLTEPELDLLTEDVPDQTDHRFHKTLYQLTGGYPAAAATITDATCRQPDSSTGSLDSVMRLRTEDLGPGLDEDPTTLEERLLTNLITALWDQPGHALIPRDEMAINVYATCALARTREEALWVAERFHVGEYIVDPFLAIGYKRAFDRGLLDALGLWSDGRTSAHEMMRYMLLRKLATREGGHTSSEISTALRDRCRDREEFDGELYYALAAGEVETVARRLTDHLDGEGIEQPWLDLLKAVTAAPRPEVDPSMDSPHDEQHKLAHAVANDPTPHLAQVALLVAGLWLANDPWTSPERRDLHRSLTHNLRTIAPYADRPTDLETEADRHEELAQDWT